MGLPDREHYLGADARMQALRDQYQLAIGHTLARLAVQGAGIAATVAARARYMNRCANLALGNLAGVYAPVNREVRQCGLGTIGRFRALHDA